MNPNLATPCTYEILQNPSPSQMGPWVGCESGTGTTLEPDGPTGLHAGIPWETAGALAPNSTPLVLISSALGVVQA